MHLTIPLINKFPLKNMSNVFEINEDEMNVVCGFYAKFFLFILKKNNFCYWSYGASNSLS